jgi:hypothetical protein
VRSHSRIGYSDASRISDFKQNYNLQLGSQGESWLNRKRISVLDPCVDNRKTRHYKLYILSGFQMGQQLSEIQRLINLRSLILYPKEKLQLGGNQSLM